MCDCGLPPSQPLLKWLPLCSSTTGLQPGTSRLGLLQLGLRGHTEPSSSSEIICRSQRLRLILFYCPRLRGMNACCGWKRVACCSFPLLMIINTFCSWKRVICFLFPVIDRRMDELCKALWASIEGHGGGSGSPALVVPSSPQSWLLSGLPLAAQTAGAGG